MIIDVKCKKSIFVNEHCNFRKYLIYEAELTEDNNLIIIDNSGELHKYINGEWQDIFNVGGSL